MLSEGESPFGRVDLHFGTSVVHAVLIVERDLNDDDLHALVQRIDDDLVWTADRPREDFLVTVYRGTERGVISDSQGEEVHEVARTHRHPPGGGVAVEMLVVVSDESYIPAMISALVA